MAQNPEAKLSLSLDAIIAGNKKQFLSQVKRRPAAPRAAPKKAIPKGVRVGGSKVVVAVPARPSRAPKGPQQQPQRAPRVVQRAGGRGPRRAQEEFMEIEEPAPRRLLGVAASGIAKRTGPPRRLMRGGGVGPAYGAPMPLMPRGPPPAAMRGAPMRASGPRMQPDGYYKRDPDADRQWAHDLFDDSAPPPRRVAAAPAGVKLHISNLHFKVTTDDIKELFGSVGAIVEAKINYGHDDRSTGTASVTFRNRIDAQTAMKNFNGVALDGQKMHIEFAPEVPSTSGGGGVFSRLSAAPAMGQGPSRGAAGAGGSGAPASRLFAQAMPRHGGMGGDLPMGMGAGHGSAAAPRRGGVAGSGRLRSGVVRSGDFMQE